MIKCSFCQQEEGLHLVLGRDYGILLCDMCWQTTVDGQKSPLQRAEDSERELKIAIKKAKDNMNKLKKERNLV